MKCLKCEGPLTTRDSKKFCSKSCANSYNNAAQPKKERTGHITFCWLCTKEFYATPTSRGKYCSLACFHENARLLSISQVAAGLGGNIKRFVKFTQGNCCAICNQGPVWNYKPLTLQLDHIDGDSDNNDISNLRLLCPNCHTQTPTYGSKGMGNRYKKMAKRNIDLRRHKGYS